MANFTPTKHEANEYNGGVQYIDSNPAQGIEGDGLQAQTVNNLVESSLYSQQQAENAVATANSANNKVNNFIASQDAPPPVGYHYIQYNGEPTPAQRWAGTTWTIDTAYQGKVLVGSGGTYTLGATGGSETHSHEYGIQYAAGYNFLFGEDNNLIAAINIPTNTTTDATYMGSVTRKPNNCYQNAAGNLMEVGSYSNIAETSEEGNIPPYKVVNIWKRTA